MTLPTGVAISSAIGLEEIKELLAVCRLPTDDIRNDAVFVVARAGAQLCGAAGVEPFGAMALLRSVAVHPAWQRRQIAHALCDEIMRRARAMGVTHVTTRIRSLTGKGRGYEAEFLVDTGAIDCMAPANRLKAAGVKPEGTGVYELADGTTRLAYRLLICHGADTKASPLASRNSPYLCLCAHPMTCGIFSPFFAASSCSLTK